MMTFDLGVDLYLYIYIHVISKYIYIGVSLPLLHPRRVIFYASKIYSNSLDGYKMRVKLCV